MSDSGTDTQKDGRALQRDLIAGLVVFLVALPLCLGIALASNAPMISGLIAGIVGGVVVASVSGSHTSVSGPAAGLAAVVVAQLASLGSFSAFALSVCLAGILQMGLGALKAGFLASFFPSSVIKGLLAAIGVLLILKQFPHVLGHDPDPIGELSFAQPDGENTFSELVASTFNIHAGAAIIGLLSVLLMFLWPRVSILKKSGIPAPLVVVGLGLGLSEWFKAAQPSLSVGRSHLVQMPLIDGFSGLSEVLQFPDFGQIGNPQIWVGALTIAVVASLETLLNLEAVDNLDPRKRVSPPNRELWAQGCGNVASGLLGGLPVTSVIVRSSVNVGANNATRWSAIFHGILLVVAVFLIPDLLNKIPLACLAGILFVTGTKLASPNLIKQMWRGGISQFLPFAVTIVSIVLIDLLIGVVIGLAVSALFILYSNFRRPMRKVMEHHLAQDVLRVKLANQVGFLSRASLELTLDGVEKGGHVVLDATETEYLDPDVLGLIRDYCHHVGPVRGVQISLEGFRDRYAELEDKIQYVDYTSRELQSQITPEQVLELLVQGNQRFRSGHRIGRTLIRQAKATAGDASPLAVIVSCVDGRASVEHIFDLGIGEVFVVRVAGTVAVDGVVGSVEYGCSVGAKLIVVLGHSTCGAVRAAIDELRSGDEAGSLCGCARLEPLLKEIQSNIPDGKVPPSSADEEEKRRFEEKVNRENVKAGMRTLRERSEKLRKGIESGKVGIVGGYYDVSSGAVEFFDPELDGVKVVVAQSRSSTAAAQF